MLADQVPAQTRARSLERLLNPTSIAVVGTSRTGGRGANVHHNLLRYGYQGRLYGVNPKYDEVLGSPCYPSIGDLPEVVDCAIIALPADPSIAVVEQGAALGVGGAIIFASGFAEMGEEGRERQRRLGALARAAGMAVCGPNCFGLMNFASGTMAFSGTVSAELDQGHVAIVSQSGGLSLEVATSLIDRGVGLTHVVSSGNEAATTLEDYLDYLVDQPEVQLLVAIVEGFKQPGLFLDIAARAATQRKPVVVLKLGRSELGRRAVASHTGALAGAESAADAAFERWGITRVRSVDEMVETVVLFARRAWPRGEGVVFVSGSGGRSALMADLADDAGLRLAEYSAEGRVALRGILPAFASVNNPLDLTGAMYDQEGIYAAALTAVAHDPAVDLLAVYQGARSPREGLREERAGRAVKLAGDVAAAARTSGKPVVTFTTVSGGIPDPQVTAVLDEANIPLLQHPEGAVRAIRHAVRYGAFLRREAEPRSEPSPIPAGAQPLLAALESDGALSEARSKQLLALFGVPVTREEVAQSPEEAEKIAERIGYPVALKASSPRLLHKTEAGLVRLGLSSGADVQQAFAELWQRAAEHLGAAPLEGILVQEMVRPEVEVLVGSAASEFGPIVLVGAGGVATELLRDTSVRLAPVTVAEARQMIPETRVGALLAEFRGRKELNRDAVAETIAHVSRMAYQLREVVAEIDINPLAVSVHGAVAVDALIARQKK